MHRVTAVRWATACLPLAMILSSASAYQSASPGTGALQPRAAVSPEMRFTWIRLSSFLLEVGDIRILLDGYITLLPESVFVGGSEGGLGFTTGPQTSDVRGVQQVVDAIGAARTLDFIFSSHSHWDHTFDLATWAKITGALVVGSQSTCFQAFAQGVPKSQCRIVQGGEMLELGPEFNVRIVRWNHAGTPTSNPHGHPPVELKAIPKVDPVTGGLRPGVAEDFPNGGGGRGYLFTLGTPGNQISWLYGSSTGLETFDQPVIVDGKNFGTPKSNLIAAMSAAGLKNIDLFISHGGRPGAQAIVPIAKPRVLFPYSGTGTFWEPFLAGMQAPFNNPDLAAYLSKEGVTLLAPRQFMDSWRLDAKGITPIPNVEVKKKLGFSGNAR